MRQENSPDNLTTENVIRLRASGLTFEQIGTRYGVTRQRVQQIGKSRLLTQATVIRLRASGLTFEQIGTRYGITRQRIHQISNGAGAAIYARRTVAFQKLAKINAKGMHKAGASIGFIAKTAGVTWTMASRYLTNN